MKALMAIAVAALVAAGCGRPAEGPADRPSGEAAVSTPEELGSTLDVRVAGDSVWLVLHVTNVSGAPLRLEYATSQRYDFEVQDGAGGVVWQWSAERLFAQALGEEVLETDASLRYEELWVAPAGGAYVARGMLTSMSHAVELRTPFEVAD